VEVDVSYYLRCLLEGLKKTTKSLSEDSQSLDRNLNYGSPEYEAGERH
jgi:hypothetical protein